MYREEAPLRLSAQEQLLALFGPDSPARELGRYCSLNLLSVVKHGTVEFRRLHGTLDGELIVQWARRQST